MLRAHIFAGRKVLCKNSFPEAYKHIRKKKGSVWIDLEEPTEEEIDFLTEKFDFHPLSIEDAVMKQDHPKIEIFDDYTLIIMHAIRLVNGEVRPEQLNIFVGKNFIVTMHEARVRAVEKAVNRVNSKKKSLATAGVDSILHILVDGIVDEYYPVIDKLDDNVDELEDMVLEERETHIIENILLQKRNILVMRKYVSLEKQIVNKLSKSEISAVKETNEAYFRDVYDHLLNMQETLEILREVVPSLIASYHSMSAKKLNRLIHRLTILATIGIPLTIVTSYYGMNLPLPEFDMGKTGNFIMWGMMLLAGLGTYIAIKIKKWI